MKTIRTLLWISGPVVISIHIGSKTTIYADEKNTLMSYCSHKNKTGQIEKVAELPILLGTTIPAMKKCVHVEAWFQKQNDLDPEYNFN